MFGRAHEAYVVEIIVSALVVALKGSMLVDERRCSSRFRIS